MQSLELVEIFILPLESEKISYMISGSVGSIFYSEPRLTHDIDLVLFINSDDLTKIEKCFPPESFYCPPIEVLQIELKRREHAHFNLIHHKTGWKADCYPHAGDPLEKWAENRRKRMKLAKELEIWLAPPEYIILRKLQYYREGKSQKHLLDTGNMLKANPEDLDDAALKDWIEKLQLETVWSEVKV